jgi:hypothetical protein
MGETHGVVHGDRRTAFVQGLGDGFGSAAMPGSGFGVEDQDARRMCHADDYTRRRRRSRRREDKKKGGKEARCLFLSFSQSLS